MTIAPQYNKSDTVNGAVPCEGAKAFCYSLDFTATTEYDFDLTADYQNKVFTTLQTVYVDNSANAQPLNIVSNGTGQTITCPPNTCGFYTLLQTMPPKLAMKTTGAIQGLFVALLNYYIPPTVWKTV